jgi:hypothetical protein
MSQYLILIYDDEAKLEQMMSERNDVIMAGHGAFAEKNGPAILGGNALQPVSTATSVRPDGNGSFTVTDGPFVETKEALGGYYLVEADDLDAAVEMARQIPTAQGGIEVRPIMTFD